MISQQSLSILSCFLFFSFLLLCPVRSSLLHQKTLRRGKTTLVCVLDQGQEFFNGCFDLSANILIGSMVLVRNVKLPSVASHLIHFSNSAVKVHDFRILLAVLKLFFFLFFVFVFFLPKQEGDYDIEDI